MKSEKRRFIRFLVPENTYAALWPTYQKVGRIKEISIDGLCFEYIADGDSDTPITHVDIFMQGDDVKKFKIPCRLVYEVPDYSRDNISQPKTILKKRRCGLHFEAIDKVSKLRLEQFLEKITVGLSAAKAAGKR